MSFPLRVLVVVAVLSLSEGFAPFKRWRTRRSASYQSAVSWSEVEAALPSADTGDAPPALTLYRDTNGWCPFCERILVALSAKQIPFEEVLIDLRNKPQWYLDMVPTALVPAIKFHDSGEIVYESLDIIKALDDRFPERQLMRDDEQVAAVMEENDKLVSAGFKFAYGVRNTTLSDEEKGRLPQEFVEQLDKLDARLAERGPFMLGSDLSAADIALLPIMERFRYQLPVTAGIKVYDASRPNIQKWFDSIDGLPAYRERITGDEVSWVLAASIFLQLFGTGDSEEGKALVDKALQEAEAALGRIAAESETVAELSKEPGSREAAAKLISNREAVIADATAADKEPKSQRALERLPASAAPVVSQVLRNAAARLVGVSPVPVDEKDSEIAAKAARFVASRVSAPRDVGAPAARVLRMALFQEEKAAQLKAA
eukprot:scaffold1790_cov257-Pinguiococcus_pyrenoidosus.AAC.2